MGCAALAMSAIPASAAPATGPATATTDAGTKCTVEADARVGGGLVAKPINFSGSIDCTLADSSNAPLSSGGVVLQNSGTPLGLGTAGAQPNDPDAQEKVPGFEGFAYRCELKPDVDCGFSGRQPLGLPGQSYTALFGTGITPPEGERWTSVSEGCELDSAGAVACASEETVTVR